MTISNWVKHLEHNGSEGSIKSYTSYSQKFKLDVLNFMNEKGMSSYEVVAIFNIPSPRLVRGERNLKMVDRMPYYQRKRGVHP